jgi:hypothetical protein
MQCVDSCRTSLLPEKTIVDRRQYDPDTRAPIVPANGVLAVFDDDCKQLADFGDGQEWILAETHLWPGSVVLGYARHVKRFRGSSDIDTDIDTYEVEFLQWMLPSDHASEDAQASEQYPHIFMVDRKTLKYGG